MLDTIVEALPLSTSAGLERHLVATGLRHAPAVTGDEIAEFVAPYMWLLAAGRKGLALDGPHVRQDLQQQWADATGSDTAA